jgi:hypothetical protein
MAALSVSLIFVIGSYSKAKPGRPACRVDVKIPRFGEPVDAPDRIT